MHTPAASQGTPPVTLLSLWQERPLPSYALPAQVENNGHSKEFERFLLLIFATIKVLLIYHVRFQRKA